VRVIVSHPARQANVYYRPCAAERAGMEVRFLTGLYYRPDRFPYSMVRWLPDGRRERIVKLLEKRRIDGLSPDNVVSLMGPTLEVALRPFGLMRAWQASHDWLASRWVSRLPEDGGSTVLHCFQDSCLRTLRAARPRRMIRLLEVTLPPLITPERWQIGRHELADAERLRKEAGESDFVLAQSEFSVRSLVALGVPAGRIVRLHLGVDTEYFRPRDGERRPGPLRFIFAGAIGRRKGVHHLLEAWRELALEDAELLLAGNTLTPGAEDLLKQEIPRCRSLGHIPDREFLEFLRQADVLVHPSLAEGGCNTVYEAMACGLPCIVSSHAGSAVRDGIEGLVVAPGDAGGLKDAIRRLAGDPALRKQLGAAARKRAESLTWDRYAEELASIYRDLAEFAGGGRQPVFSQSWA
jgi:glycosyltransferase involved in cell wall biosynthesis